jgi:hypothetical protein
MRRLIVCVALALSSCVRSSNPQPSTPEEEEDKSIIFPDFDAQFPTVVGAKRFVYELDGVTLRAIAIAADDFLPLKAKDLPCWKRQDAHRYEAIHQGERVFVSIFQDPVRCDVLALDGGLRYAINIDGRILRRLATGEPDGSRLSPSDAGAPEYLGDPVPESLVGSTELAGPDAIPPGWLDGGIQMAFHLPWKSYPPPPRLPDGGVVFPEFHARPTVVLTEQGQSYELDGETFRALRVAANDFMSRDSKEHPCRSRQETHRYQVIPQGDIIFVNVYVDPAACRGQSLTREQSVSYSITTEGRILQRVLMDLPEGSSPPPLPMSDGGTPLDGGTSLDGGAPLDGGTSLDGGAPPVPAR